jgi:uncharacterized protein
VASRLLVFAKEPQPGRVKTRLAAAIGPEAAADLAWALLEDTCQLALRAARACGAELELHHSPNEPGPRLRELARELDCRLIAQSRGSLGERLASGLAPDARARIALGSDAPDLPQALLEQAFAALEVPEAAVAAPAPDGGYVLLGLGRAAPADALADPAIRWSSATTLGDTRAVLEGAGSPLTLLSGWSDVDDLADLEALEERLTCAKGAAPATRAWLARWRSAQTP